MDGKRKEPPRGIRPRRASHGDPVATREIRQSALERETHLQTRVRSEEEGKAAGSRRYP